MTCALAPVANHREHRADKRLSAEQAEVDHRAVLARLDDDESGKENQIGGQPHED
jgi:hypothetical protein